MIKSLFTNSAKSTGRIASPYKPNNWRAKNRKWRILLIIGTLATVIVFLMLFWSREPDSLSPKESLQTYTSLKPISKNNTLSGIPAGVAITAATIGIITNHSLLMVSYLSRANTILIELTDLLERG